MSTAILRPDSRSRITLGDHLKVIEEKIGQTVSGFRITITDAGAIILEPRVEYDASEVTHLTGEARDRFLENLANPKPLPARLAKAVKRVRKMARED